MYQLFPGKMMNIQNILNKISLLAAYKTNTSYILREKKNNKIEKNRK